MDLLATYQMVVDNTHHSLDMHNITDPLHCPAISNTFKVRLITNVSGVHKLEYTEFVVNSAGTLPVFSVFSLVDLLTAGISS